MENEAFERDQTHWACAAQEPKLLPSKPVSPQKSKEQAAEKLKATVSPLFEAYYAKHGKPKRNTQ